MAATAPLRRTPDGVRGILAPAERLDRWLLVILVVLLVTCAVRYLDRHGLDAPGAAILVGAAAPSAACCPVGPGGRRSGSWAWS